VKRPRTIGKCPLCLEEGKLLAHSHIIPEFNYEELYDEKHRLRTFEGDGTVEDPKWMQKGIREYLLCGAREGIREGCEGKLSVWESHAANLLGVGKIDPLKVPQNKILEIPIQYKEFKLYGMSLIWRLAVTSQRNLAIGSLGKTQETLRQAIEAENPLEPEMFPFYIRAFLAPDGNFYSDWMSSPFWHDFYGKRAVSMAIGGLTYTFVARTPDVPEEIRLAMPQMQGGLRIPVAPISTWPEYDDFYRKQVLATKIHAAKRKA
jgi:hypothetical protein